jgi:hypothetical protein
VCVFCRQVGVFAYGADGLQFVVQDENLGWSSVARFASESADPFGFVVLQALECVSDCLEKKKIGLKIPQRRLSS